MQQITGVRIGCENLEIDIDVPEADGDVAIASVPKLRAIVTQSGTECEPVELHAGGGIWVGATYLSGCRLCLVQLAENTDLPGSAELVVTFAPIASGEVDLNQRETYELPFLRKTTNPFCLVFGNDDEGGTRITITERGGD